MGRVISRTYSSMGGRLWWFCCKVRFSLLTEFGIKERSLKQAVKTWNQWLWKSLEIIHLKVKIGKS